MNQRVIFSGHGDASVLQLVTEPQLPVPRAGEVLIRNEAVGVNFIDIYYRDGLYPVPALPSGLGCEGAGIVTALGAGVTGLRVGDRVAYTNAALGAYAQYHVVDQSRVVVLPDGISSEVAAACLLKGLTVQYLFRQIRPLQAGETVLFHAAAGGVGQIACQWARVLGLRLIAVVGSADKAAAARANGAWAVIRSDQEDIAARVLELTDGDKCDVVFDSVGQATWQASLDSLRRRGLLVSFGNASGPVTGVNLGVLAQKGSLMVTRPTLADFIVGREALQAACDELFARMLAGDIRIAQINRYPLAEAALAQQKLASRATMGSTILLP